MSRVRSWGSMGSKKVNGMVVMKIREAGMHDAKIVQVMTNFWTSKVTEDLQFSSRPCFSRSTKASIRGYLFFFFKLS